MLNRKLCVREGGGGGGGRREREQALGCFVRIHPKAVAWALCYIAI